MEATHFQGSTDAKAYIPRKRRLSQPPDLARGKKPPKNNHAVRFACQSEKHRVPNEAHVVVLRNAVIIGGLY